MSEDERLTSEREMEEMLSIVLKVAKFVAGDLHHWSVQSTMF